MDGKLKNNSDNFSQYFHMQNFVSKYVSFPPIYSTIRLFYSGKSQYEAAKIRFKIPIYLVTTSLRGSCSLSPPLYSCLCFNDQLLLLPL